MLAGWLFADLLLMLFLLALASQPKPKETTAHPTPSVTPSASPSVTQALISKNFCEFLLPVNTTAMVNDDPAAASQLIARLNKALTGHYPGEILADRTNPAGSRSSCLTQLPRQPNAGVIIAYGSSQDITTGNTVGRNAARAITRKSPRFKGASSIWGWTSEFGEDKVELIVFFIGP
jgi:hypothetical protein